MEYEWLTQAIRNSTVLHWASMFSLHSTCEWLIDKGLDVNKYSSIGTPVHCAITGYEITNLWQWVKFLELHDDLNSRYIEMSEIEGRGKVVTLLRNSGANINFPLRLNQDGDGLFYATPLYLAFETRQDYFKVEDDLLSLTLAVLKAGADCDRAFLESLNCFLVQDNEYQSSDLPKSIQEVLDIVLQIAPDVIQTPGFQNQSSRSSIQAIQSGDLTKLLMLAASNGQVEAVNKLLAITDINVDAAPDEGRTALHWAANNGFVDVIEALLNAGADVDRQDNSGSTALHLAATMNHAKVVDLLRGKGTASDIVDEAGRKPIHYAAMDGNFSVVQLLARDSQNSPIYITSVRDDALRLFHCTILSGSLEAVESSLKEFPVQDLKEKCDEGMSALHHALEGTCSTILMFLIAHELDPNDTTPDGSTALHIAMGSVTPNSLAMIELLLSANANFNARRDDGEVPLHILCRRTSNYSTRTSLIDLLAKNNADLNIQDAYGRTPLHVLCSKEHMNSSDNSRRDLVQALLRNGANVNIKDENQTIPVKQVFEAWYYSPSDAVTNTARGILMHVISLDDAAVDFYCDDLQPLSAALAHKNYSLASRILDLNSEVDQKDRRGDGMTPLVQACISGCPLDLFERLLAVSRDHFKFHKADGGNLLHHASYNGHVSLASALIRRGFTVRDRTSVEHTPLMLAAVHGHADTVQILLQEGAQPSDTDKMGWTCLHFAAEGGHNEIFRLVQLDDLPSTFNATITMRGHSVQKMSPFDFAVIHDRAETVQLILEVNKWISVDHTAESGLTPLHLAAWLGNVAVARVLLENGALVNRQENLGNVPLHYAVQSGFDNFVQLLLEKEPNLDLLNHDGLLPEDLALQNGFMKTRALLLEYKSKEGDFHERSGGGVLMDDSSSKSRLDRIARRA